MRPEGYYWVRVYARLKIAEWSDERWWLMGNDTGFEENAQRFKVVSGPLEPPK